MIDRHPTLLELLEDLGDGVRFVQCNAPGSSSHIRGDRRISLAVDRGRAEYRDAITIFSDRLFFVKIEIEVLTREITQRPLIVKISDVLVVSFPDDHQVLGKLSRSRFPVRQIPLKFAAMPANRIAQFRQPLKQIEDFAELILREFPTVNQMFQLDLFSPEGNQDLVQLRIVIDIFLALLPLNLVKRRLRNVNMPTAYQLRHLAIKEGQEKCADMRAVDVRIGHNDNSAVPQFFEVERSFAVPVSDPGADRGDHRLDFEILQ